MDYRDKINVMDSIIGNRFKSLISNKNISLSGFYLSLAERPTLPSLAPPLLDLEPQDDVDPISQITTESRDQVEEIYYYSFKLDWVQVSTTKKEGGIEIYIDEKSLPSDYSLLGDSDKYSTWFLGYKNELTGNVFPCIYGYDTRSIIKSDYSNTVSFTLDIKCNFIYHIPSSESYIKDLEYNKDIEDIPDALYYKSGELENKILSMSSYTLSPGVGRIERGILKYK